MIAHRRKHGTRANFQFVRFNRDTVPACHGRPTPTPSGLRGGRPRASKYVSGLVWQQPSRARPPVPARVPYTEPSTRTSAPGSIVKLPETLPRTCTEQLFCTIASVKSEPLISVELLITSGSGMSGWLSHDITDASAIASTPHNAATA
jgi:hypothetical protein